MNGKNTIVEKKRVEMIIYKIKVSGFNQGITLEPESKEIAHDIMDVLSGVKGIRRLSLEWEEEPVPTAPRRGRKPKQKVLQQELVDPDADFKPQIPGVVNTKPGDGGDYENTSGSYD